MKTYIASLLRHCFTALAGLGGLLLSKNLIDAGDVTQVNAAGVSLGAALVVILTAVLGRLAITGIGKIFPAVGNGVNGRTGSGGGLPAIGLLAMTVGLIGMGLPSCATTTAPDGTVTRTTDAESVSVWAGLVELGYGIWAKEHPPETAKVKRPREVTSEK